MPFFKKLIKVFAPVLFVHIIFASYRLIPVIDNFHPLSFLLPMGEIIFIYLIMNGKGFKSLRFLFSLFITSFLIFFIFGEFFYRIYYLERFNMISDMPLIPNFFVMIMPKKILPPEIVKTAAIILTVMITVFIAFLILSIIRKSADNKFTAMRNPVNISLSGAALLLIILFPGSSPVMQTSGLLLRNKAVIESSFQSSFYDKDLGEESTFQESSETAQDSENPVPVYNGMKDSDIHFVVVESYGAVLFQKPEYTEFIQNVYTDLQKMLNEDGWAVRSGYVRSPAFGGRSWLADGTLLAGEQIINQKMYDDRVSLGEPAYLLQVMGNAGYRSYYIAPGSTQTSEEWRKAYPFDKYLLRSDFGYEGPFVAFGTLTDQYAFNFFSKEIRQEDQKEFAFYILVSSHTPFERIPVYKADWDFSMKGREYSDGYIKFFENNWLYGNELAQGYLEGISYSLETTIHYLTEILSDKEFMLVIGDHQPKKPVSGPDPGYPVPFHIIVPSANTVPFPEDWNLSYGLTPPELPVDYMELPEMSEIPFLLESLIK